MRVAGPGQLLLRLGANRGKRAAIFASALLSASLLLSFGARPASAQCTLTGSPTTWSVGVSSDWNTPTNWSTGTVPNSSGINVCITDGSSAVTLDTNASVGSLQLASGNTLSINSGRTLTESGPQLANAGVITLNDNSQVNLNGSIINSGTINVDAVNNQTVLNVGQNDTATLTGGGTVVLSNTGSGTAVLTGFLGTLVNSDNTIEGDGIIGSSNGHLALVNAGTINANVTGGTLILSTNSDTNTGTLEATNGGTLAIQSTINNQNGTILASGSGSSVVLNSNNTSIQGGTLNTTGGGTMGSSGGVNGILLDGSTHGALTNAGTFNVADASQVNLVGSIINSGAFNVIDTGDGANLQLSGDTTLSGHGTITLSSSATNSAFVAANPFVGSAPTLTNVDNTIQGAGNIGGNFGLIVINQGTIDANVASGTLSITTNAFTNTNILEATNGGTLSIQSNINNGGGTISSSAGSSVLIGNSATIYGGTLNSNGGMLGAAGTVTLDGGTSYGPLTIEGTFTVNDGSAALLNNGSIINQGTIAINALTSQTGLYVNSGDTATLTGGGTVKLSSTGSATAFLEGSQGTLINADNTIEGNGFIGTSNGHLTFINQGTVDANVTSSVLFVSTNSTALAPTTNTGTFEATNGGILGIQTVLDNQNGTILSSGTNTAGTVKSSVLLTSNGTTIQGGTLNTTGGGMMGSAGSTSDTLDGSTHGAITNLGIFTVNDNSNVNIIGTIVNQGTISIAAVNNGTTLNIPQNGSATLTGGGTVVLSTTGTNVANLNGFQGTLTNVNNTIEGEGIIGSSNNHLTFINQGIVDANVASSVLYVSTSSTPSAPTTNTGTFEATSGGILGIQTIVDNQNGTILSSGPGSQVLLTSNGSTIQGGTLNTTGGGTMGSAGGTSDTLDGSTHGAITNLGTFTVNDNSFVYVNGSIINKGTISVVDMGNNPSIFLDGNTTLSGGGTVVLSSTSTTGSVANIGSCPVGCSGTYTLTNADNTIEGAGLIGQYGLSALVNGGTINANVAGGTLSVATGTISNSGLMEATGTGTLSIQANVTDIGGTIEARGSGSTVQFQNAPTIQGGFIDGIGTLSGNFTLTNGTIAPGLSASNTPGTLIVNGNFTQSGGAFDEVISGTSSYGILNVSGNLALSSGSATTLDITLANGFTPQTGETFTILDATSLTGKFSNASTFILDGFSWTLTYGTSNGEQDAVLTVGAAAANSIVTATWSSASGNWSTAANWGCTPGPTSCVPNNTSTNVYNAVLNSAGNTMTLSNTDSPSSIILNGLNVQAGTLLVTGGGWLTVTGSTTVGDTIQVQGGSTANLGNLTNLSAGTLIGGVYEAGGGGTAGVININGNVTTLASTTQIFLDQFGSKLTNGSGDALAGLTTINGGGLALFDGASENITPGGGTFSNNGGTVTSAFGGSSLTINGNFSNTNGNSLGVTVNGSGGGASLNVAGNFTNDSTGGTTMVTVENGGALNITGAGNSFTNQNGAQLLINNLGTANVAGDFTNESGAQVVLQTGGALGVSGNFVNESLGSVQVNGASLSVNGDLTNQGVAGIVVENGGSLSVKGATGVTNSSNITIGAASSETANSSLTVTNAFQNSGTLTLAATVGTTATQATVGSFNNQGNVAILTGTTLTSTGAYTQAAGGITTVEGTLQGTGGVNINGGTLEGAAGIVAGSGTINGLVTIGPGGTVMAGTGPSSSGTLNFGGAMNINNGTLAEVINSETAGGGYGVLNIAGSLTLGAGSKLDILSTYDPAAGTILTIATTGSSTAGLTFGSIENDTFTGASGNEKWVVIDSGDNIELEAELVAATVVNATWSTGSGNWNTATQWSCAPGSTTCVPNNSSNNVFDVALNSPGQTLTLDNSGGTISVNTLTLTAGTLNIQSGATLNLVSQPGGITDINANSGLILAGTFEVTNGATTTSALAGLTSVEGTLTLEGQNITTTPSGAPATFGNSGTVNLQQGTAFTVNGSLNNSGLILTGNSVGDTGGNSLTVSGPLTNSGDVLLLAANDSASTGAISNSGSIALDGANQSLTVAGSFTNLSGSNIGFNLSLEEAVLQSKNSTVSVAGAFTNDSGAAMDMAGTGDTLSAASFANSGQMYVGANETLKSTGDFANSGGSLTTSGGTVTVGGNFNNATGASLVTDGFEAIGPSSVSIGGTFTNAGTVNMEGVFDTLTVTGGFTNSGNVMVGNSETLNANGGYTNGAAAQTVLGTSGSLSTTTYQNSGGATTLGFGATITTTNFNQAGGSVQGNGFIVGAYTLSGGTITPGSLTSSTPGTLIVEGTFTQTGGTFNELMNGTSNGMLNVSGAMSLSGATLDILSTYDPAAGTTLTIAETGSSTAGLTFGTIENDTFTGASGNEKWVVIDSGDNIELEAELVAATVVNATWSTASGNWNTATQWSCAPGSTTCVPNNSSGAVYDVVLNSAGQTLTLDNSGGTITVNTLALNAGTLNIQSGATLNLINQAGGITDIASGTGLILGGTFEVNGTTSALAGLTSMEGTLMLANGQSTTVTPAGGTLTISNTSGEAVLDVIQGSALVVNGNLAAPHDGGIFVGGDGFGGLGPGGNSLSVSGALTTGTSGFIEMSSIGDSISAATLTNAGAIQFNNSNETVSVAGAFVNSGNVLLGSLSAKTTVSAATLTNSGVIDVTGSNQTVTVSGGFANNSGGALNFNASSSGSTVSVGGAFTNASGASVSMPGAGDMVTVSGAFTNGGSVTVGNSETLNANGGYTNTGTTDVTGTLNTTTYQHSGGTTTLESGGTIQATSFNQTSGLVSVGGILNSATYQQSGGTANVGGALEIGGALNRSESGGSTTVSAGGSLDVGGSLNTATFSQSGGSTTLESGGSISASSFHETGGSVQGTGTIAGAYTLSGGTITPGSLTSSTPGTLTITGNFGQTGGTFNELMNGTSNGILNVGGAMSLTGATLDILGTYDPAAGTILTIASTGSSTAGLTFGTIENDTFTGASGAEKWVVIDSGDNIELEAETVGPTNATATWSTGSGNWNTATQWSCTPGSPTCVPNNSPSAVYETVLNSPGQTLTMDTGTVTVDTLAVEAGNLHVQSALNVNGNVSNGGSVVVDANGVLNVGGNFNNASAATLETDGDVFDGGAGVTVAGTFTNSAGAAVKMIGGEDVLSASSFANSGTIFVGGGGVFVGDENLRSTGNFNNNSGGSLTVSSGGVTVGGIFSNASGASLVLDGDETGNGPSLVTVTGEFINGGTVTLNGSGDSLTAGSFANSGTITVGAGESLISKGDFDNNAGGTLSLSNLRTALTIGGNFNNAVGATVQYTDPPTGGNVTTVAGAFTNGGTLNMQGSGDSLTVAGAFTNSGGVTVGALETLNANGGYTNTGSTSVAGILNTTTYQQNAGSTEVSGTLNATTYQYKGGTTTVETGGQISAASFTQTGGSIQGTGTIGTSGGAYTITGGMITPGSSIAPSTGSLLINGSYTQSGGTFDELIGPTDNGLLSVTGPVVLEDSATLDITLLSGATLTGGEMFDIMNYTGTEDGAFANAPSGEEFALDGWNWDINYGFDGNEVLLTAESPESVPTPEPSALLLLAAGMLAVGAFYRRKSVRVER